MVIKPYELEEQGIAIMYSARNDRLNPRETTVYTKDVVQLAKRDWWVINGCILLLADDCEEYMSELRAGLNGDEISYLVDEETTLISNEQHPIAIVRDTKDRTLYVSPDYRRCLLGF